MSSDVHVPYHFFFKSHTYAAAFTRNGHNFFDTPPNQWRVCFISTQIWVSSMICSD